LFDSFQPGRILFGKFHQQCRCLRKKERMNSNNKQPKCACYMNDMDEESWKDSLLLDKWRFRDAADYALQLMTLLKRPSHIINKPNGLVVWTRVANCLEKVMVKDEHVLHNSPKPHFDIVSVTISFILGPSMMEWVVRSFPMVIVDQLKGRLTCRCSSFAVCIAVLNIVTKASLTNNTTAVEKDWIQLTDTTRKAIQELCKAIASQHL